MLRQRQTSPHSRISLPCSWSIRGAISQLSLAYLYSFMEPSPQILFHLVFSPNEENWPLGSADALHYWDLAPAEPRVLDWTSGFLHWIEDRCIVIEPRFGLAAAPLCFGIVVERGRRIVGGTRVRCGWWRGSGWFGLGLAFWVFAKGLPQIVITWLLRSLGQSEEERMERQDKGIVGKASRDPAGQGYQQGSECCRPRLRHEQAILPSFTTFTPPYLISPCHEVCKFDSSILHICRVDHNSVFQSHIELQNGFQIFSSKYDQAQQWRPHA